MILHALNSYYQRLENEPESDIAPFGFSRQKISFCVLLNADGSLHDIADLRVQGNKKLVPLPLIVPGNSKPTGSGINPCFLWDNSAYMLGYKPEDKKPGRTRESFQAFRQRHLDVDSEIDDPEFSAVCTFLRRWNPDDGTSYQTLVDIGTGFGVFRIRGASGYIHENSAVRDWWLGQIASNSGNGERVEGQCLVTGERSRIARLHEPKIKGVWGGQSSGATMVSFNFNAAESYGKSQSHNAPVSERAAFQCCTALNRLLASTDQRIQIGDATTVFWTEQPTPAETLLPWVFEPTGAENDALKNKLHSILTRIASGQYPGEFGDADTPFYVLGLSPNAARISVRFWWVSRLGNLIENLRQHFVDLAIVHSDRDPDFPAVWQLLRETVRDAKDLPPLLAGSVIRSILTGAAYPRLLYSSLLRRIRADRQVRYLRAATLKACLTRNSRLGIEPLDKELDMALDPDRPEPSYHLGRMFAEIEKAQEDALPGINDTIKDRYFSAASATPASVFPRLIRLNQHHLGKLDKGGRTFRERRIQAIADRLSEFPSQLSLRDQGLFAIGYYHQRQNIFTRRTDSNDSQTPEQE